MRRSSLLLLFSFFLIVLWVVLWKVASSLVGYVAVVLVFVGVVGETLAELFEFPHDEHKRRQLAKGSALVLIIGLAGDICDLWINDQIIGELQGKLADRVLTDEQVENIANKVRSFAGQAYRVATYEDMREPLALANRIHRSLQLGKWKYIEPTGWQTLAPGTAGVHLYIHPQADEQSKRAVDVLVSAIIDEGIGAEKRDRDDSEHLDSTIQINVGMKPE